MLDRGGPQVKGSTERGAVDRGLRRTPLNRDPCLTAVTRPCALRAGIWRGPFPRGTSELSGAGRWESGWAPLPLGRVDPQAPTWGIWKDAWNAPVPSVSEAHHVGDTSARAAFRLSF